MLKKLISKLFRKKAQEKVLTQKDISDNYAKSINEAGGHCGENFDIYGGFIDMMNPYLISIGNNVTISHSTILTHDASLKKVSGHTKLGKVTIGDNVFIGYNSIILCNTKIGNNVIIGAGTLVAKDVPDNVVVCGNPMKILYTYEDFLKKEKKIKDEGVVLDMWPSEIMTNEDAKNRLLDAKTGFML